MANDRLVLIDGSNLLYRAYHAIPTHFSTASGQPTNAVYGFATMFRKLFAGRRPELGAVVFDPPGKTFRDDKYAAYKAERTPMPDELKAQLQWVDRLVGAQGFPLLRVPGYEADDVIGTFTRQAVEAGYEVQIISGDKDFAQLVGERVRLVDSLRDVSFDPELVRKKFGVGPDGIIELFALVGDKIDNIPGVPGIGPKTATTLLQSYGDLAGIYAHIDELKGAVRKRLEEHREQAELSRELATIDLAVPLELGLEQLRLPEPDPRAVNELYRELEFYSLLEEVPDVEMASDEDADYGVLASAEAARDWLAALDAAEALAVHPIYDLPSAATGALAGLALSPRQGLARYLPLAGPDGLGAEQLQTLTGELFGDPARKLRCHNLKALWVLLERHGIRLAAQAEDIQLASYLIDPTRLIPHPLEAIAKDYLQRSLPPAKTVTGAGQKQRAFSQLEAETLGPWACLGADAVGRLWPLLEPLLADSGGERDYREIELPLVPVLGQMELDGVRVDQDDLARLGSEFGERLTEYERQIHQLAGREFNIGSTKQLSQVLFEDLGLPVVKRTKSGYSTDAEVLERLAPKHEIARLLLEHRKLAKLINTYVEVLQRFVDPESGRIHATFQMTTAATGRLISTDPDLQRTPVKTPEGLRIRRAFVPEPGLILMAADWSQIELRLLAHFTGDALLVEAFRTNDDVHKRTAAQLFGMMPELVTAQQRAVGKLVNFATIYGQGASALGNILGVPRKQAQKYIDGYFEAYSGVRRWLDRTIAEAHENGYVSTLSGRRRIIPELKSRSPMERQAGERIAANTPIQGSAADLCKLAMLKIAAGLRERGLRARMLLQIHDELVFELPPGEEQALSELVRHEMEQVWPLEVPLVVEIGVGSSWAEAK